LGGSPPRAFFPPFTKPLNPAILGRRVWFWPAAAGDCRSTFFRLARGRAAEDGRRPISAAR